MLCSSHSVNSLSLRTTNTEHTATQSPIGTNTSIPNINLGNTLNSQTSKRSVSPVYSTVKGKDKFITEEEYNRLRTGVNALLRHEENQKQIALHQSNMEQLLEDKKQLLTQRQVTVKELDDIKAKKAALFEKARLRKAQRTPIQQLIPASSGSCMVTSVASNALPKPKTFN